MAENIGADLLQKILVSVADKLPRMYRDVTGESISREQIEFINSMITSLADMVVTAVRKGGLKPVDIADLVLKRAAATVGITIGNSSIARGTKIVFALAAFALTSWELYGSLVTMSVTLEVAEGAAGAAAAVAASPAAIAGVSIIGVLYWTYLLADTIISVEKTGREVEAEIPARFNISAKRATIMNMMSDNSMPRRVRSTTP